MVEADAFKESARLIYNSQQTKPFVDFLRAEREQCRDMLETCLQPVDVIRALQGEAQAYKKILETLEALAK